MEIGELWSEATFYGKLVVIGKCQLLENLGFMENWKNQGNGENWKIPKYRKLENSGKLENR